MADPADDNSSSSNSTTASSSRPTLDFGDDKPDKQFLYDHQELLVESINTVRRDMNENVRGTLRVTMEPVGEVVVRPPGSRPCVVAFVPVRDGTGDGPDLSGLESVQSLLQDIRNLPGVATVTFETRALTDKDLLGRERCRAYFAAKMREREEADTNPPAEPNNDDNEDGQEEGTTPMTLAQQRAMRPWPPMPSMEEIQLNQRLFVTAGVEQCGRRSHRQPDGRMVHSFDLRFDGLVC